MTRLVWVFALLGALSVATACGSSHGAVSQHGLRVFDPTGKVHSEITLSNVVRRGVRVGGTYRPDVSDLYLPLTAAAKAKCDRLPNAVALELGGEVYKSDSVFCQTEPPSISVYPRISPERLVRALKLANVTTIPVGAERSFFLPGQPKQYIGCVMDFDMPGNTGLTCFAFPGFPPYNPRNFTLVKMGPSGKLTVCHGPCVGNPAGFPTLDYGNGLTLGPFHCSSRRSGVSCVVTKTGRGFDLGLTGVKRLVRIRHRR